MATNLDEMQPECPEHPHHTMTTAFINNNEARIQQEYSSMTEVCEVASSQAQSTFIQPAITQTPLLQLVPPKSEQQGLPKARHPLPGAAPLGTLPEPAVLVPPVSIRIHRKHRTHKRYSCEQRDWIRYQREDCGRKWDDITRRFKEKFPAIAQCKILWSVFLRDNLLPKIDKQGQIMKDGSGKVVYIKSADSERDNIPFQLIERKPELALMYTWVHAEHKRIARMVLDGDQNTRKAFWRRVIKEAADIEGDTSTGERNRQ